ncbi:hypothetical protein [Herbaspirillum hiltneri]|uniref:hypothetical protein n=1 Tax=Herbaspirillum hiltneri TaxID=341045 RepID=UPI001187473C|nr:hypothetical protein [Herbaspirillum hiltneri]
MSLDLLRADNAAKAGIKNRKFEAAIGDSSPAAVLRLRAEIQCSCPEKPKNNRLDRTCKSPRVCTQCEEQSTKQRPDTRTSRVTDAEEKRKRKTGRRKKERAPSAALSRRRLFAAFEPEESVAHQWQLQSVLLPPV